MDKKRHDHLVKAWTEATSLPRRLSREVKIGPITIGGTNPVAVQSMTDCDTKDIESALHQIGRIHNAGGDIVRLTTQGIREAESLRIISQRSHIDYPNTALVADVHFQPQVAYFVAEHIDKVRINPGNYNDKGGDFSALIEQCRQHDTSLRIGVNHGSLAPRMVEQYGDTPEGMVESAMEFLRACRDNNFDQVVLSMKSSNTRVMVHAYRMLTAAMHTENMHYPIHLGVTEAGNSIEGRIKSAVGIGALLSDGVGDTIRVSLTEAPENEIPTAKLLAEYFAADNHYRHAEASDIFENYDPFEYNRRSTTPIGRIGGNNLPLMLSEFNDKEKESVKDGAIVILSAKDNNSAHQWRKAIERMDHAGDQRPVILHKSYNDTDSTTLAIKAAADFGVMFIDGLADGIYIESTAGISQAVIDEIGLDILQASRARMSKTEFIACPGCGRTLYSLHDTLNTIKSRLSHLKGLKIGVMGCIVNGPGEMADADYGYVGAASGHISLYRGRELVRRNIPQQQAIDALIELIRADGRWTEE